MLETNDRFGKSFQKRPKSLSWLFFIIVIENEGGSENPDNDGLIYIFIIFNVSIIGGIVLLGILIRHYAKNKSLR